MLEQFAPWSHPRCLSRRNAQLQQCLRRCPLPRSARAGARRVGCARHTRRRAPAAAARARLARQRRRPRWLGRRAGRDPRAAARTGHPCRTPSTASEASRRWRGHEVRRHGAVLAGCRRRPGIRRPAGARAPNHRGRRRSPLADAGAADRRGCRRRHGPHPHRRRARAHRHRHRRRLDQPRDRRRHPSATRSRSPRRVPPTSHRSDAAECGLRSTTSSPPVPGRRTCTGCPRQARA